MVEGDRARSCSPAPRAPLPNCPWYSPQRLRRRILAWRLEPQLAAQVGKALGVHGAAVLQEVAQCGEAGRSEVGTRAEDAGWLGRQRHKVARNHIGLLPR